MEEGCTRPNRYLVKGQIAALVDVKEGPGMLNVFGWDEVRKVLLVDMVFPIRDAVPQVVGQVLGGRRVGTDEPKKQHTVSKKHLPPYVEMMHACLS